MRRQNAATLADSAVLHARRLERVAGTNSVTAPTVFSERRTGSFGATLEYAALFSHDGHCVTSDVAWYDAWFFQGPTDYNHELAHARVVLSVIPSPRGDRPVYKDERALFSSDVRPMGARFGYICKHAATLS